MRLKVEVWLFHVMKGVSYGSSCESRDVGGHNGRVVFRCIIMLMRE